VPPLAASSICLAHGDKRLALGAFLLFFANLVAIQFASSVVLYIHGYHKLNGAAVGHRVLVRRNLVSFLLVVGLTALLGYDFLKSIAKQQFEAKVRTALASELQAYPGVYLADLRFAAVGRTEVVTAVLRTPYSFVPKRVAALEAGLPRPKGVAVDLHIRSVITKESTRAGYLNVIPQTPDEISASPGQ
jgi:uncharacterized membrane protein